jgi:hypothetical protein
MLYNNYIKNEILRLVYLTLLKSKGKQKEQVKSSSFSFLDSSNEEDKESKESVYDDDDDEKSDKEGEENQEHDTGEITITSTTNQVF